jgi:hypothetical protein
VHLSTVILLTLPGKSLYNCSYQNIEKGVHPNKDTQLRITIYLKDGILASIYIDGLSGITIINSKGLLTNLILNHPSVISYKGWNTC